MRHWDLIGGIDAIALTCGDGLGDGLAVGALGLDGGASDGLGGGVVLLENQAADAAACDGNATARRSRHQGHFRVRERMARAQQWRANAAGGGGRQAD